MNLVETSLEHILLSTSESDNTVNPELFAISIQLEKKDLVKYPKAKDI